MRTTGTGFDAPGVRPIVRGGAEAVHHVEIGDVGIVGEAGESVVLEEVALGLGAGVGAQELPVVGEALLDQELDRLVAAPGLRQVEDARGHGDDVALLIQCPLDHVVPQVVPPPVDVMETHARGGSELPLEAHDPLVHRGAAQRRVQRGRLDAEEILDEAGKPAGRGEARRIAATLGRLRKPEVEGVTRESFIGGERVQELLEEGLVVAAEEGGEQSLAVPRGIVGEAEAWRHRGVLDQHRPVPVLSLNPLEACAEAEQPAAEDDRIAQVDGRGFLRRLARPASPEVERPERAEGAGLGIERRTGLPLRAVWIEIEEDLAFDRKAGQRIRPRSAGEVEPPLRGGLLVVDAGPQLVVRAAGLEEPVGGEVPLPARPVLETPVRNAVVEDGAQNDGTAFRVARTA